MLFFRGTRKNLVTLAGACATLSTLFKVNYFPSDMSIFLFARPLRGSNFFLGSFVAQSESKGLLTRPQILKGYRSYLEGESYRRISQQFSQERTSSPSQLAEEGPN